MTLLTVRPMCPTAPLTSLAAPLRCLTTLMTCHTAPLTHPTALLIHHTASLTRLTAPPVRLAVPLTFLAVLLMFLALLLTCLLTSTPCLTARLTLPTGLVTCRAAHSTHPAALLTCPGAHANARPPPPMQPVSLCVRYSCFLGGVRTEPGPSSSLYEVPDNHDLSPPPPSHELRLPGSGARSDTGGGGRFSKIHPDSIRPGWADPLRDGRPCYTPV
jgi:hypothetical protein